MASAKRVVSRTVVRKGSKPKTKTKKSKVVGPTLTPAIAKDRRFKAMLAGLKLPTELKEPELDVGRYSILIYGPPGIGKTTAFSGFPDTMYLTTEPGTKGMRIVEFNAENGGCTSWEVALACADLLEAEPELHKSVIVDTAEELYYQCQDFTCEDLGIDYPGVDSDGKEDRGRSWRMVRKAFVAFIQRILRTGRAVHFTSHSKEIEVKERSGNKYNKVVPTMTGQAFSVIGPLVDFIWFMDYMRSSQDANVSRVIMTQGNDFITGKSRDIGEDSIFPPMMPALGVGTYELVLAASKGEDVAVDPRTLEATPRTYKAIKKYMNKAKADALSKRSVQRVRGG